MEIPVIDTRYMIDKDHEPPEDIKLRLRGEAFIRTFKLFLEFCDNNNVSPANFKLQFFEDITTDCMRSYEDYEGNSHTKYIPPNQEWHNVRLFIREKDRLL